jgi:hypothetical protein
LTPRPDRIEKAQAPGKTFDGFLWRLFGILYGNYSFRNTLLENMNVFRDGGFRRNPPTIIYNIVACTGIHGKYA